MNIHKFEDKIEKDAKLINLKSFNNFHEVEKLIINPIIFTYKSSINHRSKLKSTLYL